MRHHVGFVVGLAAEARLLRGFTVGIGGGTSAGAPQAAAALLAGGATALVSFGFAGGLAPQCQAGQLIIPEKIIVSGAVHACDPALLAWLGGATVPLLLAGDTIAITAAEKAALHALTGAAAVDLESGALAAAIARGVPIAALRAISDPAGSDLPLAALIALNAGGKIRLGAVLASVLRQPAQIPTLLTLAADTARARATLRRQVLKLA